MSIAQQVEQLESDNKYQAAKIKELETGQLDFAKEMTRIHKGKIQRIKELETENKKMRKLLREIKQNPLAAIRPWPAAKIKL